MVKKHIINGFSFDTTEAYHDAQKEAEAVSYLIARTDMKNASSLIKLYNKLIDKQAFVTPVGISFLKEVYDNIITSGVISKENLRPIPIKLVINKQIKAADNYEQEESRLKIRLTHTQNQLKNLRIMNVFFIVIILVLFAITMFGNNSPLVSAEIKIQNKYAEWEANLAERERIVTEKEESLKNK